MKKIIVKKFGGTSLSSFEARKKAVDLIKSSVESDFKVVAVVSAMGRKGDIFSTDTLIDNLKKELPNASDTEKALLTSTGEFYSCLSVASMLRDNKLKVEIFSGADVPIITENKTFNAKIKSVGTENILKAFENNDVVVVAGFQGITEFGIVSTLGRGGSDTTATALGVALKADCVEIYTDVDGVMTADPKIYSETNKIDELNFVEMGEMASEGAKVLHTPSVEIAEKYDVDILVKNTFSDDKGTRVSKNAKNTEIVTGFIHRKDITDFFVDYTLVNNYPKRQRGLFKSLAEKHISLDLINICGKKVYFAVNSSDTEAVRQHLIDTGMRFFERDNVAKISCIGAGMKGTAGVMAKVVNQLKKANIKIYRSVDSLINISCIIDEDKLQNAMKILHELINYK